MFRLKTIIIYLVLLITTMCFTFSYRGYGFFNQRQLDNYMDSMYLYKLGGLVE